MARNKSKKSNVDRYLGPNSYPAAPSQVHGTDPYAYLREQPQAPEIPKAPANVHGLTLGNHVDASIPQAPDSLNFLPQEQATEGGFIPTQPRKPGQRPKMLNSALGFMWFIAFCVVFFAIFLAVDLLPDTGLFSPRPMNLSDKILLALITGFMVAGLAMPAFLVVAYNRMWGAFGLVACSAGVGAVLFIADTGFIPYVPMAITLLCFMPQNLRFYGRTRQYRREVKAYKAFVAARNAQRTTNVPSDVAGDLTGESVDLAMTRREKRLAQQLNSRLKNRS